MKIRDIRATPVNIPFTAPYRLQLRLDRVADQDGGRGA